MDKIIQIALGIWCLFYLYNYRFTSGKFRKYLQNNLPESIKYVLSCSFCFGFWISLFFVGPPNNFALPLIVSVLVYFIEILYFTFSPVSLPRLEVTVEKREEPPLSVGDVILGKRIEVKPVESTIKVWSQTQPGGLANES